MSEKAASAGHSHPTPPPGQPAAESRGQPAADPGGDVGVPRASREARLIADLVAHLDEDDARDLQALLSRCLRPPSLAQVRAARLGLLVELVEQASGQMPTPQVYEALRGDRRDEEWPSASSVSRAYGGWLRAVAAAISLHTHPGAPARRRGPWLKRRYSRPDAAAAIARCCEYLADEPSQPEYAEFRRLARQLARWAGDPDPGLPDTDTVRQLFGTWQAAVQAARQHSDTDAGDENGVETG